MWVRSGDQEPTESSFFATSVQPTDRESYFAMACAVL